MQCAAARPSAAPVGGRRAALARSSAPQPHVAAPRRVAVRAATEEKVRLAASLRCPGPWRSHET